MSKNLVSGMCQTAQKNMESYSIFWTIPEVTTKVVITGVAMRTRNYKNMDPSNSVDIRLVDENNQGTPKTTNVPEFINTLWNDLGKLFSDHGVKITKIMPETARPNLRDYQWIETMIPCVIHTRYNEKNNRWQIASIEGLPEISVHDEEEVPA